jgi:serine/threonine-protein kinase
VVSNDPRIGWTLGPYRIEKEIARGGMGIVYHAFDERLERSVALKLLRDDLAADKEFRARFISESRAAAALDHPNILPVFDAGETDGVLFLAARLVDGSDLRRALAREGTLDPERALAIAGQVAGALDLAHSRGLVHRDIKPANVLLVPGERGDEEHAYLIDFGISKRADAGPGHTGTGQFVGTAGYAAPEQIRGQLVDGRADQYALACMVYEMLAGRPVFSAGTAVDLLHAHLHQAPPPLSQARTGAPASIDAAITRALDKNPLRRFETCRALVAAARASATRPDPAATLSAARLPRPPRVAAPAAMAAPIPRARGRAVAALTSVLLLAGAGVAAAVLLGGSRGPTASGRTLSTVIREGTVVTVTVPTSPVASTPNTASDLKTVGTEGGPALEASFPHIDVASLPTTTHNLDGFSLDLPDWALVADDESQPSPPSIMRRRTEVSDPDHGVSVLVDHLTGFDVPAVENRANLDRAYARTKPGYERLGMTTYEIGSRPIYEWRYRFLDNGKETRRVDLMFDDGGHSFAVLAKGHATYDDLADLAKSVAESVVVTEPVAQ